MEDGTEGCQPDDGSPETSQGAVTSGEAFGLAAPDDVPITRGEIHERDVSGPVLPRGQSHLVKPARFRRIRLVDS